MICFLSMMVDLYKRHLLVIDMFSGTLLYFPYPNSFDQLKIYNLKGSELNFEKKEEVGMDFYHQTITRQKMKAKHLIAMPSAVSR
ncbi:hypothetical protein BBM24_15695 [Vibrio parahaemolyticus]|nr:hypothetical protein M634_21445 [Vibrio parahaemolyticus O1:Kuk str. FDA_R31]EGR0748183.1 hypothetical protein [Vibrio parahaemolyticus]KIT49207.1 hypothetical protein H331_15265 [Vibrio parahaemolyticus 3644]KIT59220.1 hypothetical protein H336_01280 [Vibrio parahaemolyticus EN9701072]KJQ85551.1 hypothetical protein UG53_18180 [Vibrio sp. S512-13]KJQ91833.1 hypothetical protein UF05_08665 [Vibrio sp. S457-15]